MKAFASILIWFLPFIMLGGISRAGEPEKLRVFVPVLPYEYLLERIGGDWIEVSAIVQEGGDCHNYSPTPRQMTELSKANLIFTGDITFESNFFVADGDGISSPKSINLLEGLELLEGTCGECASTETEHTAEGKDEHEHEHEHEHTHDEIKDTHVWLSPRMLQLQADRVATVLKDHLPAEAATDIEANVIALKLDLAKLDTEIKAMLAPMKGQAFYVYHGAFGYFAADYGLEQKAIEIAGRSPSPKQVTAIAKQAREENVKAIFVQPQFDESSAVSLAETIGGKVQTLDPLAKDVINNLRTIAETIRSTQ